MIEFNSELWKRVQEIDLSPIRFKLVNCDEGGEPWTPEKVFAVEPAYRQYLYLTEVSGQSSSVVPTVEIDQFWHAHILDTAKYAADCDFMFGHFLHHFPYLGMRGEEDVQQLHDSFAETGKMFEQHFGSAPPGYPTDSAGSLANCGDTGSCGGCDHRAEAANCGDTGSCGGCDHRVVNLVSVRPRLEAYVQ